MSIDINVLGVLTWEYAAFQAAVLTSFKNNFVTFTFTGLIDKFANGLHLKQGRFRSVCWKYRTKHFQQIKAHLGLFVLTRSLVDVNLNGDLWENSKNWFFSNSTWFLYLYFFVFFSFTLLEPLGKISMSGHSACPA